MQSYKTEAKQLAVVSELRAAMQAGRPVPGRVLNAVNGGYSVGVAGIVGFLPSSRASVNTVKKIGVLQPFLILTLEELTTHVNLVLTDPYPRPRTRRIIRGRLL